jgi:3-hydroxyisobutyrate dehydrogenase-like beta-hydroxyacid dehydrogenase
VSPPSIGSNRPSVGFIGFGEAGFHIARGLKDAGLESITAYDLNAETPGQGERIQRHSATSGVGLVDSPKSLAAASDILLSVVMADQAIEAARQSAPFLETRHLYADLNSVSPETKQCIDSIVTARGARFVEVTIMASVPPHLHRVPMLLAGPSANDFYEVFSPFGMQMDVVSDKVGAAASVKLCRSIIVKGLEALMIECSLAACHYGADERVFASLGESFPGLDWGKLAGYMASRVAMHGERRAREMDEAARMLDAIGIEPIMAAAAARRQDWCGALGIGASFKDAPPEDYKAIAEAISALATGRDSGIVSLSVTEDSQHG